MSYKHINKVEEYLYIGDLIGAENLTLLSEMDIKFVLSVFDGELNSKSKNIVYKNIWAFDTLCFDLLTEFPETNDFIKRGHEMKANVLVHCQAGISRSATIVLAFLMNKYKMKLDSALVLLKNRRNVWPNSAFIEQLQLYEEMKFTLNANNRELRIHLVKTRLEAFIYFTHKIKDKIQEYFRRRDLCEQMTESLVLGEKCVCIKCGEHLFNEIHILKANEKNNINSKYMKEPCTWTYIEPQKWMNQLYKPFEEINKFEINCNKCGEQLIEFNRNFINYECNCFKHFGLDDLCFRFRIANNKFKI